MPLLAPFIAPSPNSRTWRRHFRYFATLLCHWNPCPLRSLKALTPCSTSKTLCNRFHYPIIQVPLRVSVLCLALSQQTPVRLPMAQVPLRISVFRPALSQQTPVRSMAQDLLQISVFRPALSQQMSARIPMAQVPLRISVRRTFPEKVLGSSLTNSMARGILYAAALALT